MMNTEELFATYANQVQGKSSAVECHIDGHTDFHSDGPYGDRHTDTHNDIG